DEHPGAMQRIATSKGFDDDVAGIDFVIVSDFASVQSPGAGDRSVKIIGVGCSEGGNGAATLRPGRGEKAVGVNDAANFSKRSIEDEVSVSVRAGLQIALDDFSGIERDDDHMAWLHRGVGNARRFDDDVPAGVVNAADIAPGLDDKTLGDQLQVCSADLLFESVEHLRRLEQLDLSFF